MKRSELKNLIFECYVDILRKQSLKEDVEKEQNMVYGGVNEGDESVLPDSTDQILAKFPTLKHCLVRLHTDDYPEFVAGIDWISPKPTGFRINLKNGQNYILTWKGKDFEAEISGKKYYLGQLIDFQQALSKLEVLYQEGPMGPEEEPEEGGAPGGEGGDFGGAGGGAGDFPGGDMGGEEAPEEGGEEAGGDESSGEDEDFSKEKVDFEDGGSF